MMMWSSAGLVSRPERGRGREDLARYAKLEYGDSEIGWLLAQISPKKRARLWVRFRYWIGRRLTSRIRQRRELRKEIVAHPEAVEPRASTLLKGYVDASERLTIGDGVGPEECVTPSIEVSQ